MFPDFYCYKYLYYKLPCNTHWWMSLISCLGQIPGNGIVREPWYRWQIALKRGYTDFCYQEYLNIHCPKLLLELVFEVFIFYFTSVISTESPLVPWSRQRDLGNELFQLSFSFSPSWERAVFSLVARFSPPRALSGLGGLPAELVNTVGRAELPWHTVISTSVSIWQ